MYTLTALLAVLVIVAGLVVVGLAAERLLKPTPEKDKSIVTGDEAGPFLQYAGFWRRLGAHFLDFLFLLPLGITILCLAERYRLFPAIYFIPGHIFSIFYNVVLVKKYGGTPGKIVGGLRIAKLDGSPVGYREAILRELPEFTLNATISLGFLWTDFKISNDEYASLSVMQRYRLEISRAPAWFHPVEILQNCWIWGEFLVLLTNRKRRAIHDFIAGTVVLVRKPNPSPHPKLAPVLTPAGP